MKHFHILQLVRFEFHMTVSMNNAVFRDMTQCTLAKVY